MDSNGIDKMPKTLENRVECSQEVSKSIDRIHNYDAPLQTNKSPPGTSRGTEDEGHSLLEVTSINLNQLSNARPEGLKDQRTSTSSALRNRPLGEQSDLCLTPGANDRRINMLQSSSVVEVSQLKDRSLSPSPLVRRGLDHCITAPVHRNLFLESQEVAFSRSMTEKRGSPMAALKLDRLSEHEKLSGLDDSPVACILHFYGSGG